jgi:hypothetical protein
MKEQAEKSVGENPSRAISVRRVSRAEEDSNTTDRDCQDKETANLFF